MKNRRTIRKYLAKDISSELLNELLETAFRASTTGNMQLYSVVVARDQERIEKLAPAHFHQTAIKTAPVVLTFCADVSRFTKWCEERKAVAGFANFQSFMNAFMDAIIVAQAFCTAAEDAGLGICYLGTTTYNPELIIEALDLPKLVFPATTITVGYPDGMPEQVDRLPVDGIVHQECYQNYSSADIDRIYGFKESLEENKRFITENGKETLAQVFTDIRYTKKDNERISENLLKGIKKQGFF